MFWINKFSKGKKINWNTVHIFSLNIMHKTRKHTIVNRVKAVDSVLTYIV